MSQITTGLRSVLSAPLIYETLQNLLGARKARKMVARELIRAKPGMRVLDLGCGPAALLEFLPNIDYHGFDISEPYIQFARKKYGANGKFDFKILSINEFANLPKFDIAIIHGVLHHLNDAESVELIKKASVSLKIGGRLIIREPCYVDNQNKIARFIIDCDRGQNVRNLDSYISLVEPVFKNSNYYIKHKVWVPYTHCVFECIK